MSLHLILVKRKKTVQKPQRNDARKHRFVLHQVYCNADKLSVLRKITMVETRRQKAARNAIVISDTEDDEEEPEETKQPIPEYLAQRMQKGSHSMQQGDNERKSREGGPKRLPDLLRNLRYK